jgi:hypothetical protein
MNESLPVQPMKAKVNAPLRALLGFVFGLALMFFIVNIFVINDFDFENMQRGIKALTSAINPWAPETRLYHFYNPPFSIIFLWPLLFTSPQFMVMLGGAALCALIFYHKTWVAMSWFGTNSFLFLIAAGGIDMYVMGAGLLILTASEELYRKRYAVFLRVLAYGFLLVKPQGGIFIVALYILMRRDWLGVLLSVLIYGLPFIYLYPDWLHVILSDPPLAQTVASHSLWGKFGPYIAIPIAIMVMFARRWHYYQLGGALAGILSPYGMAGIPIFITLSAITKLRAIPMILIFSGCLATVTWIVPPFPVPNFYDFVNPLMSIYHLGMLGLALILACYSPNNTQDNMSSIDLREPLIASIKTLISRIERRS